MCDAVTGGNGNAVNGFGASSAIVDDRIHPSDTMIESVKISSGRKDFYSCLEGGEMKSRIFHVNISHQRCHTDQSHDGGTT